MSLIGRNSKNMFIIPEEKGGDEKFLHSSSLEEAYSADNKDKVEV